MSNTLIAPDSPLLDSCDVLIAGSGIVGLAHAVAALDAGHRVVVVERDSRPVGASIRNFGHVCVTGQAGDLAELAAVSRERWLTMAARADVRVAESGGVAVARGADELAVLEELQDSRPDAVRLLTREQIRALLGGAGSDSIVGGAHLVADLRVDPRTAAGTIATWLAGQDGARVHFGTAYLGTDGTHAVTSRGRVRADRVVVCVGHDLDYLYPDLAEANDVRRCALQMALVEGPGATIAPAVLTATSLLRYDAFAQTSAAAALRARITAASPDLVGIDANVMFTQRPDGRLLIGDSHHTERTVDPFLEEDTTETIHREICRVLGVDRLTFRQRWQGVYASSGRAPYLAADFGDHLSVRSVTSGVGMTISFGLAQRTFPN
ncbi:TIGR03364 family FAD-dependent oxidoreductase [Tsukamurella soli]|uniref:TIGR03364 family FAD-dependent oxidoreductase n=1 Tax=Tsukamurella soli TaxID=644556 RepID=A0ABP8JMP7_9ACTN